MDSTKYQNDEEMKTVTSLDALPVLKNTIKNVLLSSEP